MTRPTRLDHPCIGWRDPDGCPIWGWVFHGCKHGRHRSNDHECECGATWHGTAWRREEGQ